MHHFLQAQAVQQTVPHAMHVLWSSFNWVVTLSLKFNQSVLLLSTSSNNSNKMPDLCQVPFVWDWYDMVWREISKLIWLFWMISMSLQMLLMAFWSPILKIWNQSPTLTLSLPFRKEFLHELTLGSKQTNFDVWKLILISKLYNCSKIMKSTVIRPLKSHAKTSGSGISLMVIFNAQECFWSRLDFTVFTVHKGWSKWFLIKVMMKNWTENASAIRNSLLHSVTNNCQSLIMLKVFSPDLFPIRNSVNSWNG